MGKSEMYVSGGECDGVKNEYFINLCINKLKEIENLFGVLKGEELVCIDRIDRTNKQYLFYLSDKCGYPRGGYPYAFSLDDFELSPVEVGTEVVESNLDFPRRYWNNKRLVVDALEKRYEFGILRKFKPTGFRLVMEALYGVVGELCEVELPDLYAIGDYFVNLIATVVDMSEWSRYGKWEDFVEGNSELVQFLKLEVNEKLEEVGKDCSDYYYEPEIVRELYSSSLVLLDIAERYYSGEIGFKINGYLFGTICRYLGEMVKECRREMQYGFGSIFCSVKQLGKRIDYIEECMRIEEHYCLGDSLAVSPRMRGYCRELESEREEGGLWIPM